MPRGAGLRNPHTQSFGLPLGMMPAGLSFGGSGQNLYRTTNLPSSTSFTLTAWVKVRSVRAGQYQYFLGLENATSSSSKYLLLGYANTGMLDLSSDAGSATPTSPTLGAWTFFAITCAGTGATDFKLYHAQQGSTFVTASATGSSFTTAWVTIGNDSFDEWCNVDVANVKIWDRVLDAGELYQERDSFRPLSHYKLNAWLPIFPGAHRRAEFVSGRRYDFSTSGVESIVPPPIAGRWFEQELFAAKRLKLFRPSAGGLTISGAGAIATGEAFGTLKNNFKLFPSALGSSEAQGTSKLNFKLAPTAIATGEAHGSPKLNLRVAPAAFASGEAHGTAKLNFKLFPPSAGTSEAHGATRLGMFVRPSGIGTGEAHGNAKLNLRVLLNGLASGETLGSARLRLYLLPGGIATGETHGTQKLNFRVFPSGLASAGVIGSHLVSTGALLIGPSGIAGAEAFGATKLNLKLFMNALASGEAHGSQKVNLRLLMQALATGEAFGTVIFGGTITAIRHFTLRARSAAFTLAERVRDD